MRISVTGATGFVGCVVMHVTQYATTGRFAAATARLIHDAGLPTGLPGTLAARSRRAQHGRRSTAKKLDAPRVAGLLSRGAGD